VSAREGCAAVFSRVASASCFTRVASDPAPDAAAAAAADDADADAVAVAVADADADAVGLWLGPAEAAAATTVLLSHDTGAARGLHPNTALRFLPVRRDSDGAPKDSTVPS
jgi:hypothetical protein